MIGTEAVYRSYGLAARPVVGKRSLCSEVEAEATMERKEVRMQT